jgi:hypothetical protein
MPLLSATTALPQVATSSHPIDYSNENMPLAQMECAQAATFLIAILAPAGA